MIIRSRSPTLIKEPTDQPYTQSQSSRSSRSRRFLWPGGLLALVAIGTVVYLAAQGGSGGLDPSSVAEAAERTSAEPGGSIETEITYGVAGASKSVAATGSGIFDSHSGHARIELSVPGADGSPVKVESVGNEKKTFVSSRILSAELPPGKEWLGMEPLLGQDPTTAFSAGGGAKGSLEMLRAVGGDIERIGEEAVRGESTTQYKGTIDLSQAARKFAARGDATLAHLYRQIASRIAEPIPVEVWIGVGGLVRRERLTERVPTEGGQALEMKIGIDFFDFAAHPDIELPPQHLVLDYTPVLRAELGMMDGSSLGALRPPAGAERLSVPAFGQQATAICRATLARGKPLAAKGQLLQRELGAADGSGTNLSEVKPKILALGLWLERSVFRSSSDEISELAALAPPAKYAADFRRYLTIYTQQAEWELAEARAFQAGAYTALDKAKHAAEAAPRTKELARILPRLGILECGREIGSSPASRSA
jgi:hypothetical protein